MRLFNKNFWLSGFLIFAVAASPVLLSSCEDDNDAEPDDDEEQQDGTIVISDNIESDRVLENRYDDPGRADYLIEGGTVDVTARLTIEPGVRILMSQDARLRIRTDGILVAEGTANENIIITGTEPQNGWWRSIRMESPHQDNIIAHAVIEYGGGDSHSNSDANIVLHGDGYLQVSDVVSRYSQRYGMRIDDDAQMPEFSNNVFSHNEMNPIVLEPPHMAFVEESNQFSENGNNTILVDGSSNIERGQTWSKTAIPFFINTSGTIRIEDDLEIEPGFHAIMNHDSRIEVRQEGSLNAVGTEQDSIIFDSESEIRGYWRSITFNSSLSLDNVFEYVSMTHGGGGTREGIIVVRGDSRLEISNSSIRNSDGYGIHVTDTDADFINGGNNHFSNNRLGDIEE